MKQWIGTLFFCLTAVGCSHMERVDEAYTSTDPTFQKTFARSLKDCQATSAKTLDENGRRSRANSGRRNRK